MKARWDVVGALREREWALMASVREEIRGELRNLFRIRESDRLDLVENSFVLELASNVHPRTVLGP